MAVIRFLYAIAVIFAVAMLPVSMSIQLAAAIDSSGDSAIPVIPRQRSNVVEIVEAPYVPSGTNNADILTGGGQFVWVHSPNKQTEAVAKDVESQLCSSGKASGTSLSTTKPALFRTCGDLASKTPEISDTEPTLKIEFWAPGMPMPSCARETIVQIDGGYLFKGSSGVFLGGAGFYMPCGSDGRIPIMLIAGNSIAALEAAAAEYTTSASLTSPIDVKNYLDDESLNTLFVTLGNPFLGSGWVKEYGGEQSPVIYNGYAFDPELANNLAPGSKLVLIGRAKDYLSSKYEGTLAHSIYSSLLSSAGYSLTTTHIYGCNASKLEHIASDFTVFSKSGEANAGPLTVSGFTFPASKSVFSDYALYHQDGGKILVTGLSYDSVGKAAANKKTSESTAIPACSDNPCKSGQSFCFGTLICDSAPGIDRDGDGYTIAAGDCDDCPYDDVNLDIEFECPINQSRLDCEIDSNNDGIGDYASCAYCRNPGMTEKCDNIDNNCAGRCQGDPARLPKVCKVSDYAGDGNISSDCDLVPANKWGVQDSFCQMVDDVYVEEFGPCLGYSRCVKWAQYSGEDAGVTARLDFVPGSVSGLDAQCGYTTTASAFGASTINTGMDCLLDSEVSANAWTPSLPRQYIDSMRGELDFEAFLAGKLQLESKTAMHEGRVIPQISNAISQVPGAPHFEFNYHISDLTKTSLWKWNTACVAKDKCLDGADNDGYENIFETVPYAYYVMEIDEIQNAATGESVPVKNEFSVRFADVDDPECKFVAGHRTLSSFDSPLKDLPDSLYLANPRTNASYCLDDDRDGFCGCDSLMTNPRGVCLEWGADEVEMYTGTLIRNCLKWGPSTTCNSDGIHDYVLPKQFMDCDDKPGSNAYLMNGNTLRASPNLGWKDDYVGEEYSAWHVHPFSPVNLHTCNLMSYDFNCNKGRDDGYDYSLLKQGGTPFDWDISTGREYAEPGGLLNAFSYPADLDMACHTENAYKPAIKKTMGAVAIVILIVGVSSFGIGALVKAGVVAKGSLLASIGVGSGSAGMVGGLALSATDALICISSLLDRKNADWSWSGVTEHCVGMTIDATLFGVSMVGRGLSKGKLLLSTAGKSDDAYRAVRVLGKDDDASRAMLTGLDDVADNARFIDAPRPGCFLAGTQIMLANGTLANIEDIKVGDMIMAYDLANKSAVAAPVTTTFARNATEYLIIEYEPV